MTRRVCMVLVLCILLCACGAPAAIPRVDGRVDAAEVTQTPPCVETEVPLLPSASVVATPTATTTPTVVATPTIQRNAWGGVGRDPRDIARDVVNGRLTEEAGYAEACAAGFRGDFTAWLVFKDAVSRVEEE